MACRVCRIRSNDGSIMSAGCLTQGNPRQPKKTQENQIQTDPPLPGFGDSTIQNTAQAKAGRIARRHLRTENTASADIFTGIVPFRRTAEGRCAALTKTSRSRISRANCPRWPGSTGAAHLGRKRPVSGRPALADLISFQGKLFLGKLPGQRRTAREADLSTQQTGAQAPSRLPRPPRDDRWPQGSRRAPRAGPQAFERLSRASRKTSSWIG
jgi:hypothetical protein